jgi:two-component system, sporulation sensor kinase C
MDSMDARRRSRNHILPNAGLMTAWLAHEINNPLAGIKSAFALIKQCVVTSHPSHKYVGLIDREIERISDLARQMLNISSPIADTVRPFCIGDSLHDVAMLLRPLCDDYAVKLAFSLPDVPLAVELPERLLNQVVFNLIKNAVEASPKGASVTISVAATSDRLSVAIQDEGSGIPGPIRNRMFEPFFSTKLIHKRGCSGLGLAISESLVLAMGGALHVDCGLNRGAVFTVELPRFLGQEAVTWTMRRES